MIIFIVGVVLVFAAYLLMYIDPTDGFTEGQTKIYSLIVFLLGYMGLFLFALGAVLAVQ